MEGTSTDMPWPLQEGQHKIGQGLRIRMQIRMARLIQHLKQLLVLVLQMLNILVTDVNNTPVNLSSCDKQAVLLSIVLHIPLGSKPGQNHPPLHFPSEFYSKSTDETKSVRTLQVEPGP